MLCVWRLSLVLYVLNELVIQVNSESDTQDCRWQKPISKPGLDAPKLCHGAGGTSFVWTCQANESSVPTHCMDKNSARKECLRTRSNSRIDSVAPFDPSPLPSCTPYIYVKNMKTGGSTLNSILTFHDRTMGLTKNVDYRREEWAIPSLLRQHGNPNKKFDRFLWITGMRQP
mgnify:CR=1 FL=1